MSDDPRPSPFPSTVPWRAVMAFVVLAFGLAWLVDLPLWLGAPDFAIR